jgi:hypothetical protein
LQLNNSITKEFYFLWQYTIFLPASCYQFIMLGQYVWFLVQILKLIATNLQTINYRMETCLIQINQIEEKDSFITCILTFTRIKKCTLFPLVCWVEFLVPQTKTNVNLFPCLTPLPQLFKLGDTLLYMNLGSFDRCILEFIVYNNILANLQ